MDANTTPTRPRFSGVVVVLEGAEYTVPPLGMRALRELLPRIRALELIDGIPSDLSVFVDVAHAALTRNYPAMERDWLEDVIDVSNVNALAEACFGKASGLVPARAEAASDPNGVAPSRGG